MSLPGWQSHLAVISAIMAEEARLPALRSQ